MRTLLLTSCLLSACQCGDVRLGALRLNVSVSPEAIDFGNVAVGTEAVQALTFENISRAPIEVTTLTVEGDGAFEVVPRRSFTLAPGQSRVIDVVYAPSASGAHSGRVRAESTGGALFVALIGTASATSVADAGHDAGLAFDAGGAPDSGTQVVDAGPDDAGTPAPPECGTANATDTNVTPTSGLCTTGTATPLEGNGPWRWRCEGRGTVDCSTASYWVTGEHEFLRSVRLGRPVGAQQYVSNMTRLEFVNNTAVPVQVLVRLVDPLNRFIWNDGTPMVMRREVLATVGAGRRVAPSVLWNSPDDTGTPGDPCNRVTSPVGVEFIVNSTKVASFKVHAKSRAPFTCAGGLVTWSATSPNSGGPCRATVPAATEFSLPDEVQASTSESDPGFRGKQGVSCSANAWAMDACGVSFPTAGTPLTTFPKYGGTDACAQ